MKLDPAKVIEDINELVRIGYALDHVDHIEKDMVRAMIEWQYSRQYEMTMIDTKTNCAPVWCSGSLLKY